MIREQLAAKGVGRDNGFRWRAGEITRVEGFSDAVFAFAITLLVVSLEVPRTFNELVVAMRGFFAFAICFAILVVVWYNHYRFFRRYGLQDAVTVTLNGVLLFVVLFYVYPLKFAFTMLVNQLLGVPNAVRVASGLIEPAIEDYQAPSLMLIYGLGFLAVSLVFVLLYGRAYRLRRMLELSDLETFDTRVAVAANLVDAGVGVTSVLVACTGTPRAAMWSGLTYFALGPLRTAHGIWAGRRRRKLEAGAVSSTATADE